MSLRTIVVAALAIAGAGCSRPAPPAGDGAAGPREISVRVPAALRIARSLDTISVSFDPAARATTRIVVGAGKVVGIETEWFVYPVGRERPSAGRHGFQSGTDFDTGTSTWSVVTDGIPAPGTRYVAEVRVAVFETDVPPGHLWDPHAGTYEALWTRTLRQAEE